MWVQLFYNGLVVTNSVDGQERESINQPVNRNGGERKLHRLFVIIRDLEHIGAEPAQRLHYKCWKFGELPRQVDVVEHFQVYCWRRVHARTLAAAKR